MAVNTEGIKKKYSLEHIFNLSFDELTQLLMVEQGTFDGQSIQRGSWPNLTLKLTTAGDVTYFAQAAPGTAQATAKWQARKIDRSSGVVITWADGDSDFDNVATDLTSLTYT